MEKKESYFKRVKKPITSIEEAKPIQKETKIYFIISLAGFVAFGILSGVINSLSEVFAIIGFICFIPTAYFGIMLYVIARALKRFKNLHCECGAQFINDENMTWKEIKRWWKNYSDEAKLYVTVRFTCKCPKCGKIKSFDETLCSGKIRVGNYTTRNTIVSTQSLVDDYFAGIIHA